MDIIGVLHNVGSGRGIASVDLDSGCHLVITFTDGTTWTSDETLRGVTSAGVTDEYKLKLTYEDGTTWTSSQSIRGPIGPSSDTLVQAMGLSVVNGEVCQTYNI